MGEGKPIHILVPHWMTTVYNLPSKELVYGLFRPNLSYGVLCHYGRFQMPLLMNKGTNIVMDDGQVHPLAKTLPSLVSNL